ncbi:hypothetical protein A7W90_16175 [Clostridium sp. Bc-iso-3]|nr:hypothetical protein A7W90_16175 [Clostridium sp. Bc-iso-3]
MDLEKEYELLLRRFRHLLLIGENTPASKRSESGSSSIESDIINLYDEVDPRTKKYKRDIKELDILFEQVIERIIEGEGIEESKGIYPRSK